MDDQKTGRDGGAAALLPYEISVDAALRCLFITLRGHWTHAVFEDFAAALGAAEAEMARFAGTTHTLADGRLFEMQDVDVAERFAPLIQSFGLDQRRRSAIVALGPLARTQARTAGDVVNARYFRTVEDATDWLFGDEA